MAPPVSGGNFRPGTTASRRWASSSSRIGSGSVAGPWPGPVLRIFLGSVSTVNHCNRIMSSILPAPTKLYRPLVSELAALSNKNEYLAWNL